MALEWRRRGTIDATRYARIHDGWMTYCAALPAGMGLPAACQDFKETAKYGDSDGKTVECVATLIENGREVGEHRMVIELPT